MSNYYIYNDGIWIIYVGTIYRVDEHNLYVIVENIRYDPNIIILKT